MPALSPWPPSGLRMVCPLTKWWLFIHLTWTELKEYTFLCLGFTLYLSCIASLWLLFPCSRKALVFPTVIRLLWFHHQTSVYVLCSFHLDRESIWPMHFWTGHLFQPSLLNHELKTATLLLGYGRNFFPSFVCQWPFPSGVVWESVPLPFFGLCKSHSDRIEERVLWVHVCVLTTVWPWLHWEIAVGS